MNIEAVVRRLVLEVEHTIAPNRVAHIITASVTLNAAQRYIRVDATGGPVTVTLSPASELIGEIVWVGETENTPNAVTIQASGSELIAGLPTFSLAGGARHAVTLRSFGTGWDILTTY